MFCLTKGILGRYTLDDAKNGKYGVGLWKAYNIPIIKYVHDLVTIVCSKT